MTSLEDRLDSVLRRVDGVTIENAPDGTVRCSYRSRSDPLSRRHIVYSADARIALGRVLDGEARYDLMTDEERQAIVEAEKTMGAEVAKAIEELGR